MKTKILLLAAILLTTFTVDARMPRVKNKSFSYETIKLPQMALPENRTYMMYFETAPDYGNLALRYQNALQIPGWVKAANGEFNVEVKLFSVDYAFPQIVSRKQVIKDTNGKVVKTRWFYKNVYKAVGTGALDIIDRNNQAVYSNVLNEVCLQMTGKEFSSKKDARRHSFKEGQRFQEQMAVNFVQSFTTQVNKRLDVMLGIYPVRKRSSLMIVRNKKHSEYQLMNSFWDRFQTVTVQVNANSDLKEIEGKLFNEIAYLKNIENKYRSTKKEDRKIRYMAYRNLSTIYEMLEMPQEAIFFAQKIRSNDFRKFNAAYVIADAQRMERLQAIHGS